MRTGLESDLTLGVTRLMGSDISTDEDFAQFFATEVSGQVQRAHLLIGSVDDANDIVQQAFTRIYERWGSLDHPGSYLNRVVLNLCRDRARRLVVSRRALRNLEVADDPPEREILDDVLAQLPFNQRAAIVLRYWGQLSTDEIATQLECPRGSVGPWIGRGLKTMKEALHD